MPPFAVYFPQFYPTPTNDRVWGKGFTDWALLANLNHRLTDADRRAPSRGFYDGADPTVHEAQITEMQAAGLGGIGLYHYWFHSHQELDRFEHTLRSRKGSAPMPWFLIWATESWSKRWVGDSTMIIEMDTDPDADRIAAHCRHLAACFAHPDYYRWHGRPLFVWYNLAHFINPARTIERYRNVLAGMGIDVAMANFVKYAADIALCAYTDVSYIFEPRMFFNFGRLDRGPMAKRAFNTATSLLGRYNADKMLDIANSLLRPKAQLFSAENYMAYLTSDARADFLRGIGHDHQDVISPGWNNRPRYQGSVFTALAPLEPDQFCSLITRAIGASTLPPLINAWNEWSESAAIEPCAYLGSRYLDAVTRAIAAKPTV
jgi:hypothetical protein